MDSKVPLQKIVEKHYFYFLFYHVSLEQLRA